MERTRIIDRLEHSGGPNRHPQLGLPRPSSVERPRYASRPSLNGFNIVRSFRSPEARRRHDYEAMISRIQHLERCEQVLREERNSALDSRARAERRIVHLEHELDQSFQRQIANNARIEGLERELSDLRLSVQEARRGTKKLQHDVRVAQEAMIRSMNENTTRSMEDKAVRDKFQELEEQLRAWARANAVDDLSKLRSFVADDMNKVIAHLEGYCLQEEWTTFLSRFTTLGNKIPYLFSQAILAKEIFDRVLGGPFFFFPASSGYRNTPSREQLNSLYNSLSLCDFPKSQVWRSQLLSILSICKGEPLTESHVQKGLATFARRITRTILNGPIKVLLKPVSDEAEIENRSKALHSLVLAIGEFAVRLWTQRTYVRLKNISSLQKFSSADPKMSAHRLHRIEEDDDFLDRSSIVILTQPVILAFGDENGENYDHCKIWARAVACMEEPA